MPKKTAYSRSGAQRNKTKQKSFELVRPVSDDKVLDTAASSEIEDDEEDAVVEVTASGDEEVDEVEAEVEVEEVPEVKAKAGKSVGAKVAIPAAAVASAPPATVGSPRSAAARLAARRQAAQKVQRSSTNLITAEHYAYVRKDLIFILILAVILFGVIIALHFVLGS